MPQTFSMQQYLYKIQPVRPGMLSEGPTEQESRAVSDHYSYLKELMEQGTVILAGRTQNTDYSSFGIVIFNAQSLEMALRVVENDPAVKNTVMRAELYPLQDCPVQRWQYRVATEGSWGPREKSNRT